MKTNKDKSLCDFITGILDKYNIQYQLNWKCDLLEIIPDMHKSSIRYDVKGIYTDLDVIDRQPEPSLQINTNIELLTGIYGPQQIMTGSSYIKKEDLMSCDSPIDLINSQIKWNCDQIAKILFDNTKLLK